MIEYNQFTLLMNTRNACMHTIIGLFRLVLNLQHRSLYSFLKMCKTQIRLFFKVQTFSKNRKKNCLGNVQVKTQTLIYGMSHFFEIFRLVLNSSAYNTRDFKNGFLKIVFTCAFYYIAISCFWAFLTRKHQIESIHLISGKQGIGGK